MSSRFESLSNLCNDNDLAAATRIDILRLAWVVFLGSRCAAALGCVPRSLLGNMFVPGG
jgi:hypothetical protein